MMRSIRPGFRSCIPAGILALAVIAALWALSAGSPAFAGTAAAADNDKTKAVDPAVEAAVDAARKTPLPDYSALQGAADIQDAIHAATGNTQTLEALRQDGQGMLFAPGRTEADRCKSAGDPTCLAVQVVDRESTTRPEIDPDVSGDLEAGRDEIVGNAEDWVHIEGTGSTGTCRPNISTVVKPSVTHTCDVRVSQESTSETHACLIAWESILEESSRWMCRIVDRKEFSATCSVPVVVKQETTSTVACYEGVKNATPASCSVTVTAETKEKHLAVCVRPRYRTIVRQCSKRLVVKPSGTCTVGTVTEATNTDYAALTEDSIPGVETLTVSAACRERAGNLPEVAFSTNSVTGGACDITVSTAEPVFDIPLSVSGGSVRFAGTTHCNGRDCITEARMTVWAGTGAASVYSGEVFVRLAFIRFMKTGEADYWQEDCAEHEIAGTAAFESQSIKLKKGIESASAVPGDALRSTRRGEEAKEKGFLSILSAANAGAAGIYGTFGTVGTVENVGKTGEVLKARMALEIETAEKAAGEGR